MHRADPLHRREPAVNACAGLVVSLCLLLGACHSLQAPGMPDLPKAPEAFREARNLKAAEPGKTPAAAADGAWWKVFADPQLDTLISQASDNNTSIQLAANRLAKARALTRQSQAQALPQINASAGYSRQDGPLVNAAGSSGSLWNIGASLAWEADLSGRIAKDIQAGTFDAQAQEASLRATRLLIQSEVAQTYFRLCGLDSELAMMEATLQSYRESLRLSLARQAAGSMAELDVSRVQGALAGSEAEVLALRRQRSEAVNAIALLLGLAPSALELEALSWRAELPDIPPGIPSAVLNRRPDIAAAHHRLQAAHARAGVAARFGLPNVSIGTSSGFAASELGRLLAMSAHAWGINALLSLPLFDGGRRQAGLDAATTDLQAALIQYQEHALIAYKEVEDQLSALQWLSQQAQVQARAVVAASRSTQLSGQRYQNGSASQFEWLEAQRQEWRSRRLASGIRTARYQASVALVKAMGGGWGAAPDPAIQLSRARP